MGKSKIIRSKLMMRRKWLSEYVWACYRTRPLFFRRIAQSSTLFFTYQSFLVTEWSRTVPGPGLSNICWAPRALIREETIKDKFNMGPSYTNSVIERWSTARLDTKTILQINHKYTPIIPHTPYQPHRGVANGGVCGVSPPPPKKK